MEAADYDMLWNTGLRRAAEPGHWAIGVLNASITNDVSSVQ